MWLGGQRGCKDDDGRDGGGRRRRRGVCGGEEAGGECVASRELMGEGEEYHDRRQEEGKGEGGKGWQSVWWRVRKKKKDGGKGEYLEVKRGKE